MGRRLLGGMPGLLDAGSGFGAGREERGYTLMEVLVVVSVLLLLTLIVIPNLPGRKIQANEVSAIQALRGIYAAEVLYESTYPSRGFACSLRAWGGGGGGGGGPRGWGPPPQRGTGPGAACRPGFGRKKRLPLQRGTMHRGRRGKSQHSHRLRGHGDSEDRGHYRPSRLLHRSGR